MKVWERGNGTRGPLEGEVSVCLLKLGRERGAGAGTGQTEDNGEGLG
jgi:hypothetical protein